MSTFDDVRTELEALHAFFVRWFGGDVPATDDVFAEGLVDRLDPTFVIVQPAGQLMSKADIERGIRAGYGKSPGFRIAIRNVVVQRELADILVVTYEEWQRNAQASEPPDNGRAATVLFRREADGTLRWLHVHETWLPEKVMQAGPYDF